MGQEHIDFTTPGGDTVTQALHKTEDNFNDLYPQVAAALNQVAVASFKNKLINGNFDFWQRGTSLAAYQNNNKFCADRWYTSAVGTTIAPSQQAFALGQTTVPNNPYFFHRAVVATVAGASNYALMSQPIEDVVPLSGKTVTVSFWAKADANKNLGFEFTQNFGAGGSAAVLGVGAQQFALTNSWQKFTTTFTVPSIAGKTLGSGSIKSELLFWFDAGSTFASRNGGMTQQSGTFDISQVQLEVGSASTQFELRPTQVELALCKRYYQKAYGINVAPGTAIGAGNSIYQVGFPGLSANQVSIRGDFEVAMRASPTFTTYDAGGTPGKCSFVNGGSWSNGGNISAMISSYRGFYAQLSGLTSGITQVEFYWTADAEL